MKSPPAASSPSGDLPAGTLVAGFRIERLLGHGSRATVYEATQISLGRRVALKIMHNGAAADRVRRLSWPEHPGAVQMFGTGDSDHGPWLAMRLVSGGTLATRRAALEAASGALDRAHAQGVVHGDVSARNVLVEDGRAYLSDFGLVEGTEAGDRAAMAQLVRERSPRHRRRPALLLGGAALVLAAAVFAIASAGDDPAPVPPAPPGTRSVGSELDGPADSLDCNGRAPTGSSLACTIAQRSLAGRPAVIPVDGEIVSWAVRGAHGPLSLQVLRGRGGHYVQADKSPEIDVPGPEPYLVRTRMAVLAGDRVALEVSPGAAVGLRREGPRASIDRWFGPVLEPARAPERPAGTGLDRELLLRVDVRPRAGAPGIAPLRGAAAAARAPAGRRLDSTALAVGGGQVRTVTVVMLGDGVAVDLFDGRRRLARAPVPGADRRGRLVALSDGESAVTVRWRNPDGRVVEPRIGVSRDGLP